MTTDSRLPSLDLYSRIANALANDPALEAALLHDFEGTLADRFNAVMKVPSRLVRTKSGYRLSMNGHEFEINKPSPNGELNDTELELVSGGGLWDDPNICGGGPVEGRKKDTGWYKYDHSGQRVS